MSILSQLVEFSNKYGSDSSLVLAGGGNTSAKENGMVYVKGSGTRLATITAEQFVRMDLSALNAIFKNTYPEDDDEREALVLKDLMLARMPGEGTKRPSVETMLHGIFEQTFVLHLHPTLVNGLTCSKGGRELAEKLLGTDIIWIDACKPGYILSAICFEKMQEYKLAKGKPADIVLLQNHGIFIAGNTVCELGSKLENVMNKLTAALLPAYSGDAVECDGSVACKIAALCGAEVLHIGTPAAARLTMSKESACAVLSPFTPDHIVYCKAYPLWIEDASRLSEEVSAYKAKHGFAPRVIAVKGKGIYCAGQDEKQAKTVEMLFNDAIGIAEYSRSFGGPLCMSEQLTDFIVNWEVESYRSSQNK